MESLTADIVAPKTMSVTLSKSEHLDDHIVNEMFLGWDKGQLLPNEARETTRLAGGRSKTGQVLYGQTINKTSIG
jgi:hypothetical protein